MTDYDSFINMLLYTNTHYQTGTVHNFGFYISILKGVKTATFLFDKNKKFHSVDLF